MKTEKFEELKDITMTGIREIDYRLEYENDIKQFLKEIDDSNTKLCFNKFIEEYDDEDENCRNKTFYILSLYGGLNGRGQFLFYLEDVAKLIKKLTIRFDRVWLIDWKNDCPDDVFEIRLGMRLNY